MRVCACVCDVCVHLRPARCAHVCVHARARDQRRTRTCARRRKDGAPCPSAARCTRSAAPAQSHTASSMKVWSGAVQCAVHVARVCESPRACVMWRSVVRNTRRNDALYFGGALNAAAWRGHHVVHVLGRRPRRVVAHLHRHEARQHVVARLGPASRDETSCLHAPTTGTLAAESEWRAFQKCAGSASAMITQQPRSRARAAATARDMCGDHVAGNVAQTMYRGFSGGGWQSQLAAGEGALGWGGGWGR